MSNAPAGDVFAPVAWCAQQAEFEEVKPDNNVITKGSRHEPQGRVDWSTTCQAREQSTQFISSNKQWKRTEQKFIEPRTTQNAGKPAHSLLRACVEIKIMFTNLDRHGEPCHTLQWTKELPSISFHRLNWISSFARHFALGAPFWQMRCSAQHWQSSAAVWQHGVGPDTGTSLFKLQDRVCSCLVVCIGVGILCYKFHWQLLECPQQTCCV